MSERKIADGIHEHSFDRAEDFLDALRPLGDLWRQIDGMAGQWIFRGHGNAAWKLLPTAHRPESWAHYQDPELPLPAVDASERDWLERERRILHRFFNALDLAGLPYPVEPLVLESALKDLHDEWPARHVIPALALAQHYGVPTRLLDWSRQGRVAAYFAAQASPTNAESLAVWAAHGGFLMDTCSRGYGVKCRLATAPRASNPNLHAQAGIFAYAQFREDLPPETAHRVDFAPLEDLVAGFAGQRIYMASGTVDLPESGCVMRKLVLPRSQADQLLKLLHADGVSGITMFPGLAGISTYLKERCRVRLPDAPF